ncbi:uncharacterized protein N7483_010777 [Penicillium malachiteum]|uniref:uncharacterized protein n=1 Tax=Penicillium malachiteum TaxID=1324776 RepID=UPI002547C351|nr:uncharacterized protein N7483_010777 [Penicillium malachiteum]KAJ5713596.1 hypothetical protein N7483_010777 [Penicillium malachiteum]
MNGFTLTDIQKQAFTCPHCLKLCFLPGFLASSVAPVLDFGAPAPLSQSSLNLGGFPLPATSKLSLDNVPQRVTAFGRPVSPPKLSPVPQRVTAFGRPVSTPLGNSTSAFTPVFGAPTISNELFPGHVSPLLGNGTSAFTPAFGAPALSYTPNPSLGIPETPKPSAFISAFGAPALPHTSG